MALADATLVTTATANDKNFPGMIPPEANDGTIIGSLFGDQRFSISI